MATIIEKDTLLKDNENNEADVPFKHASDTRVEGEPFVRLSRAEKKKLKYERAKQTRAAQHKKLKAKKKDEYAQAMASLTPEEKEATIREQKEKATERAIMTENHLKKALVHGLRVAIDLSFSSNELDVNDIQDGSISNASYDDEKLVEGGSIQQSQSNKTIVTVNSVRETTSLAKQLTYLYGALRKREGLISLNLVSYCGLVREKLISNGCERWLVHRKENPLEECFDTDELIYLTPDAEDELVDLDMSKVYVVGGIVDRTPNKNISINKANNLKVRTARLPLSLVEGFKSRNVILNIDTVVRALAAFQDTGDWSTALLRVLPGRHVMKARGEMPSNSKKRKQNTEEDDKGEEKEEEEEDKKERK